MPCVAGRYADDHGAGRGCCYAPTTPPVVSARAGLGVSAAADPPRRMVGAASCGAGFSALIAAASLDSSSEQNCPHGREPVPEAAAGPSRHGTDSAGSRISDRHCCQPPGSRPTPAAGGAVRITDLLRHSHRRRRSRAARRGWSRAPTSAYGRRRCSRLRRGRKVRAVRRSPREAPDGPVSSGSPDVGQDASMPLLPDHDGVDGTAMRRPRRSSASQQPSCSSPRATPGARNRRSWQRCWLRPRKPTSTRPRQTCPTWPSSYPASAGRRTDVCGPAARTDARGKGAHPGRGCPWPGLVRVDGHGAGGDQPVGGVRTVATETP
jgi:hypothetical protein